MKVVYKYYESFVVLRHRANEIEKNFFGIRAARGGCPVGGVPVLGRQPGAHFRYEFQENFETFFELFA